MASRKRNDTEASPKASMAKTPQEKKILSYQKDRRNTYGESTHGARKAIPRRKAWVNRSYRHTTRQQLGTANTGADHHLDPLGKVKRKGCVKAADTRLGDVVYAKHARRNTMGVNQAPPAPSLTQVEAKRRVLQRRDRESQWSHW
jgi:hypothetical protein